MISVILMSCAGRSHVFHMTGIALQTESVQKVAIWKKNILVLETFHLVPNPALQCHRSTETAQKIQPKGIWNYQEVLQDQIQVIPVTL